MISQSSFGTTTDAKAVERYTLQAGKLKMSVLTYGAIIHELYVPDKRGDVADIVLGFDSVTAYERENTYFGCVVGRYANRIAKGRFSLDGKTYQLAQNHGDNHLHGGLRGFDKQVWQAQIDGDALLLQLDSPDGEEGYPGTVQVRVRYQLDDDGLDISYQAETDAPTIINLTNHSYFNLAGRGDVLSHLVRLNAQQFTPVDEQFIPLGELRGVANTPFDFREARALGERIHDSNEQLRRTGGYDHNWVLETKPEGDSKIPDAEVYEPDSGRSLRLYTTQPGMQLYSGNLLEPGIGKGARPYPKHGGLCLETQHFPDSPNQPHFPSVRLEPGDVYQHKTRFVFDAL